MVHLENPGATAPCNNVQTLFWGLRVSPSQPNTLLQPQVNRIYCASSYTKIQEKNIQQSSETQTSLVHSNTCQSLLSTFLHKLGHFPFSLQKISTKSEKNKQTKNWNPPDGSYHILHLHIQILILKKENAPTVTFVILVILTERYHTHRTRSQ